MAALGHFHPLCSMSWNGSLSLNSSPAGRMPAAEGVGPGCVRTHSLGHVLTSAGERERPLRRPQFLMASETLHDLRPRNQPLISWDFIGSLRAPTEW